MATIKNYLGYENIKVEVIRFECQYFKNVPIALPYKIPVTAPWTQGCESCWKKMIGKPYSGELNVRFAEGELETYDRYSP
jgi:hypothetical protein